MWIFWALLQRDYYICAALGGTKAAKLISASAAQKLQIEADYANAGKNSQTAALLLLAGALLTGFVVVSVQRCCYQREFGTLPSPYQYKKLESEAAVEAFKLNMEKLAKGQGKRRADMYFATMNKKNPSDILKSAYENLVAVNKFDEAFPSLEDYQELQAQAVMGISRDDRVSKTELLRRANMPCIKALIMKPKLRGVGHVVRTDDARLPKMVFFSDLATCARSIRHPLKRFKHGLKQKIQLNPILG